MKVFRRVVQYVRSWPWYFQAGGAVLVVAVVAVGGHALFRSNNDALTAQQQVPHVRVASVASLSLQTVGPLPVTGNIVSLDHATILAQSSGPVVSLTRSLGDFVPAGGIIAELENASQRAAVLQAKGVYQAAQAAFASAGTTAQNSGIGANQAVQNVANAQATVNTTLQSLYTALDDAIHTKADLLFTNPRTNPILQLTLTDNQLLITLQNERTALEHTLALASAKASATTRVDTDADIAAMTSYGQTAVVFLNDLVEAVNKAVPTSVVTSSQISAFQTSIGAARSQVTTALAALPSAKTSYDNAVAGAATASNTAGAGTNNSISAAQAQVTQAQGALDAAQAALEKTIVRSPISGTIVSLPITRGDFVTQNAQVAAVSNPGALQVETNVTPADAKTLAVGGSATIGQSTKGVIVSIAPALDPTTGKVLVKLGIVGSQAALTDGDTVSVTIARATAAQIKRATPADNSILIPIVAAKITPKGPTVFQVSASSTLTSIPVVLGTILGDQVTVLSGISSDMNIVTDARGLSEGDSVVVDTQ